MADTITYKQFRELKEAYECLDDQQFMEKLKEYTGITRKPATCYNYYDADGDYLGNSDDYELIDILGNAYIEICDAPHVEVYCPNCGAKMDGGADNGR